MQKREKLLVAATSLIVIAYLWGVVNGSLARGSFAHQQIVAFCTGIFVAVTMRMLLQKREH